MSLPHAHLVFVTKYRRAVFTRPILTFAETTLRGVCAEPDDHVHLARPLKGRTAYTIRREYTGAGIRARMREHLWSPSHFAVSRRGAPVSIVKQYIDKPNPTTLSAGLRPTANRIG